MLKWGLPGGGTNLLKSRRPLMSTSPPRSGDRVHKDHIPGVQVSLRATVVTRRTRHLSSFRTPQFKQHGSFTGELWRGVNGSVAGGGARWRGRARGDLMGDGTVMADGSDARSHVAEPEARWGARTGRVRPAGEGQHVEGLVTARLRGVGRWAQRMVWSAAQGVPPLAVSRLPLRAAARRGCTYRPVSVVARAAQARWAAAPPMALWHVSVVADRQPA